MSRPAHAARRTRNTDRWLIAADSVHPFGSPPFVAMTLQPVDEAGRRHTGPAVVVTMTLGEAHRVGCNLVGQVAALLSGQKRPWDDDPGRVPFASRGGRRSGTRSARAAASPADGHPPRSAAPPATRPGQGVESGA